jgi:hypothetical protein
MKKLHDFLNEDSVSAHEKAKMLGLAYAGFGRWRDPRTNKITYKTEGDELVPVTDEESLSLEDGEADEDPLEKKAKKQDESPMGKLGMQAGDMVGPAGEGDAQVPDDEEEPDAAQAPSDYNQGQGWDPGPDGDHCVGGEEPKPEGVTKDAFVPRGTNDKKWVAGPDGSNLTNEETMNEATTTGNPTGTGLQSPQEKAKAMGLQSDGHGGYRDSKTGQLVARTVNGELAFYDSGPSGGIVADGNGGAYVTQAQPSWRDPRSGMAMTPPATAETPQEQSSVPPPVPATPPLGFNAFMKKKHDQAYQEPPEQEAPAPSAPTPPGPVASPDMPAAGVIGQ